jgi:hypothetical protein
MFREILRAQWKWSGAVVLLCATAAFALPILSLQNTIIADSPDRALITASNRAEHFLAVMERWSPIYTLLAAGLGLAVATLAWASDHRGKHVYTLTLPVERWRFVLMRFASGASLLLIPVLTLLAGALLAVSNVAIPDGLVPYPTALAFRFALAAVVAYAIFFAISAGTTRTAAVVLAPLGVLIVADLVLGVTGQPANVTGSVAEMLLSWPGLLEVFTGRWLLVDV